MSGCHGQTHIARNGNGSEPTHCRTFYIFFAFPFQHGGGPSLCARMNEELLPLPVIRQHLARGGPANFSKGTEEIWSLCRHSVLTTFAQRLTSIATAASSM